jgi:hypothetical protein
MQGPRVQDLDKVVREVAPKYDEKFLNKLQEFIVDICDHGDAEIGELRIYDLHMALHLATKA